MKYEVQVQLHSALRLRPPGEAVCRPPGEAVCRIVLPTILQTASPGGLNLRAECN